MPNFAKDTYDSYVKEGQQKEKDAYDLYRGYSNEASLPKRSFGATLKDVGVTAAKSIVGTGEAAVGLLDLPAGGRVGEALEKHIGYDPAYTQEVLSRGYSEAQQEANRRVEEAKGFSGKLKAYMEHPSVAMHQVGESILPMLGGGAIAKGVLKAAPKIAPYLAGAIGEGAVGAGSSREQIRQQKEGAATAGDSLKAIGSGIGTAFLGAAGGRLAQKFGFADVDTMMASWNKATGGKKKAKDVVKNIIGGGVSEGVFEEMPQSAQEAVWMNAALDRPLLEGVPEQAAGGLVTGGMMGGGANIGATGLGALPAPKPETVKPPDGPLTKATKAHKPFTAEERYEAYQPEAPPDTGILARGALAKAKETKDKNLEMDKLMSELYPEEFKITEKLTKKYPHLQKDFNRQLFDLDYINSLRETVSESEWNEFSEKALSRLQEMNKPDDPGITDENWEATKTSVLRILQQEAGVKAKDIKVKKAKEKRQGVVVEEEVPKEERLSEVYRKKVQGVYGPENVFVSKKPFKTSKSAVNTVAGRDKKSGVKIDDFVYKPIRQGAGYAVRRIAVKDWQAGDKAYQEYQPKLPGEKEKVVKKLPEKPPPSKPVTEIFKRKTVPYKSAGMALNAIKKKDIRAGLNPEDYTYEVVTDRHGVAVKRTVGKKSEVPKPKLRIQPELADAFGLMKEQVAGAETRQVTTKPDGYGVTSTPSTYPDWFKQKQPKGSPFAGKWSKKEFDVLIRKMEVGKTLTDKQIERWNELEQVAQYLNKNEPGLAEVQDIIDLEKKGFEPVGQEMAVGNLKAGDKVVIKEHGTTDEYEHKGYDEKGNAILEDGDTKKLDPFQMVDVQAIKKTEKEEKAFEPTEKRVEEIKDAEKISGVEGEVPAEGVRGREGEGVSGEDIREPGERPVKGGKVVAAPEPAVVKAEKLHKASYGLKPKNSLERLLQAKQILDDAGYSKSKELYTENERLIANYKEQLGIKTDLPTSVETVAKSSEVAAVSPIKKEPWEMTEEEFWKEFVFHGSPYTLGKIKKGSFYSNYDYAKGYAKIPGSGPGSGKIYAVKKSDIQEITAEKEDISGQAEIDVGGSLRSGKEHKAFEVRRFKPHQAIVEKALAEGKAIPSEILEKYPGLQKKKIVVAPSKKASTAVEEKPTKVSEPTSEFKLEDRPELATMQVNAKAIRESTGEIVSDTENAKIALEQVDSDVLTFQKLLDCL